MKTTTGAEPARTRIRSPSTTPSYENKTQPRYRFEPAYLGVARYWAAKHYDTAGRSIGQPWRQRDVQCWLLQLCASLSMAFQCSRTPKRNQSHISFDQRSNNARRRVLGGRHRSDRLRYQQTGDT